MSDLELELLDGEEEEELEGPKKKKGESALKENDRKIARMLEELGGKTLHDETLDRGGDKIRIPKGMSLLEAERFVRKQRKAQDEIINFYKTFDYRPWDGAWCMWNVLKRVFGAVSHETAIRMGFFGPVKEPPSFIDIRSGPNEITQVPWGALRIPAIPDTVFTLDQTGNKETGPLFHVSVEGPRKDRAAVEGVFKLVQEELATNSLYRGKAFDGATMPNFLDLSTIDPTRVVYSKEAQEQLQANVWTQIEHADELEARGVATKRCVLLHGEWGTGKTLAAFLTAQVATDNGWTFIRSRPGTDNLDEVMSTARLYAPAVVFFEDIDVISNPEELGADEASKLLDAFDGIASKDRKVVAVMTTNHIERIHKGMVRPGRLDAVIKLAGLDAPGIVTLLLANLPHDIVDVDDVVMNGEAVAEAHVGYTPAYVVESAGRAIRYAVARGNGNGAVKIRAADLVKSGEGLRNQLEIMQGAGIIDKRASIDGLVKTTVSKEIRTALNETGEYDLEVK